MFFSLYTDSTYSELTTLGFNYYTFEPGVYYLTVDDNGFKFDFNSYSLNISEIKGDKSYVELDYSSLLTTDKSEFGNINKLNDYIILTPYDNAPGFAYNMYVEAGKTYKLTYDVYSSQPIIMLPTITLLTGNELQGNQYDFNGDLLALQSNFIFRRFTENKVSYIYTADNTSNIRVLTQCAFQDVSQTINYILKVEEISVNPFAFTPIALPYFNEEVAFIPGSVYEMSDSQKAKGFKFTLNKDTTVVFSAYNDYYNWGPALSVFRNEALDDTVVYNQWLNGYSVNLSAGTYYVLVSDYNFYYSQYYSCPLSISMGNNPRNSSISLVELLNSSKEIDYNNLPYVHSGTFDAASTTLVQGNDMFRYIGGYYYADAYKIHLDIDDSIKIHLSQFANAYLYLYVNIDGVYSLLDTSDDDYDGTLGYNNFFDSYLEFKATESLDYYIVATTYSTYNAGGTGDFFLSVWNVGDEPTHKFIKLEPDKTNIQMQTNATEQEIMAALLNLKIIGITQYNDFIVISNNINNWGISDDHKTAIFYPIKMEGFSFENNLELTITINGDIYTDQDQNLSNINVYASNHTIFIENVPIGTKLDIFDKAGRQVKSMILNSSYEKIKLLQNGVFIVRIGKESFKIIIK